MIEGRIVGTFSGVENTAKVEVIPSAPASSAGTQWEPFWNSRQSLSTVNY